MGGARPARDSSGAVPRFGCGREEPRLHLPLLGAPDWGLCGWARPPTPALPPLPHTFAGGAGDVRGAIRAGSLAERSSCLWPKARSRCQAPAGLGVSLCPEWGEEQQRWGILSWSGGTLGETEQLSCVLLAVISQMGRERCLADLLQPVRHAAGRDLALL